MENKRRSIDMNKLKHRITKTISTEEALKDVEPFYNEETYTDEVGGFHDGGIGWNPQGVWCGECSRSSCKDCVNEKHTK